MRFVSLSSGSKGNATLICTDSTSILIDCGLSAKKINECLKALGTGLDSIDALLLTHEHTDHIKGTKRLMQAYGIPVYGTSGTLGSLARVTGDEYFSMAGRRLMEEVYADRDFTIGDIRILPFHTYHDVAEPCAYRFEIYQEGRKTDGGERRRHVEAAVMTDCGHADSYIEDHLKLLDIMLLESNHDLNMLLEGPYPYFLKERIRGDYGHLSNEASARLLKGVISPRLKSVLLGHLSHENNTHVLALNTALDMIRAAYGSEVSEGLDINVAPEGAISKIVEL